jgi:hypothetical protein
MIKKFNQFILENVNIADMRKNILDIRGKEVDVIGSKDILPGFEADNREGDEDKSYYDLVSPVDSKGEVHVLAKLSVEKGKITNIEQMNDESINDYLTNKK